MPIINGNGLLNTDKRVLTSLQVLATERDQDTQPITQAELSQHALVSPRSVHTCLRRLQEAGLIGICGGGRGVSPIYVILQDGDEVLEAYR